MSGAAPRPIEYADLEEFENVIARLLQVDEALYILRLRAQTPEDVSEAQFARDHVWESLEMLRAWRNRKAPKA
jgi:hypothetical protein